MWEGKGEIWGYPSYPGMRFTAPLSQRFPNILVRPGAHLVVYRAAAPLALAELVLEILVRPRFLILPAVIPAATGSDTDSDRSWQPAFLSILAAVAGLFALTPVKRQTVCAPFARFAPIVYL